MSTYNRDKYLKYQRGRYTTVYKSRKMNDKVNMLRKVFNLPKASTSAILRLCLDRIFEAVQEGNNGKG